MKRKSKILSMILCFTIVFSCIVLIKPNSTYALVWNPENLSIPYVQIKNDKLSEIDLHFDVPDDLGTAVSWVGLQSNQFNAGNINEGDYGDLTDYGTIYSKGYTGIKDVKADNNFMAEYGIEGFCDEEGFECFGPHYYSVSTTISDLNIPMNQDKDYYIYLWTQYNGCFYPDKLIGTVSINNGEVRIANYEQQNVNIGETDTFQTIEKVEIENSNTSLKVGESPTFTAKVKENDYNIEITETFVSEDRASSFTTDKQSSGDEDGLVKDYKYIYVIDLNLDVDSDFRFDKTPKVLVNGTEKNIAYVSRSGCSLIISEDQDTVTPDGYVEPAKLEENFEKSQMARVEEEILKAIKEGTVKFRDEETKGIVQEALENEQEISIEIYVSEAISKNRSASFYEDDVLNDINSKITEGQNFGAYYTVCILVYVDGDYAGPIEELENPISITIPTTNGLPNVSQGNKRVWKVIRYHNGATTVIDAKETADGISFMNDKFSDFGLVYEDVEETNEPTGESNEPTETDETTDAGEKNKLEETVNNPKTGDNIRIYIGLMIVTMLGLVVTIKVAKKKSFSLLKN